MDSDVSLKEVLEDLYTLLEGIETQNIALMQFLTDQKIAPEDKLRPYLEQAGNASSVKWRAARARMNHLFAPAPKKATEAVAKPAAAEPSAGGGHDTDTAKPQSATSFPSDKTQEHWPADGRNEDQHAERRDQREQDRSERLKEDQASSDQRASDSGASPQSRHRDPVFESQPKPEKEI